MLSIATMPVRKLHPRGWVGARPQADQTRACGQLARAFLFAGAMALASVGVTGTASAGKIERTFAPNPAASDVRVDHSVWDGLLKTYIKPDAHGLNRVDYKAFKASGAKALDGYLAALQRVDVTKLGRAEQFAFWVNLYNAKTIAIVLSKYPVKSIKKINLGGSLFSAVTGGPWDAKVVKVNGVKLSLNDIEHKILRPLFRDPRAHYAVNCASVGCPNLSTSAYTGKTLSSQLDQGAKTYINSSRGVAIRGGKITTSSIYKWFNKDFGGNEAGVLKHLLKYADADLRSKIRSINAIDGYDYDWSLNDVAN